MRHQRRANHLAPMVRHDVHITNEAHVTDRDMNPRFRQMTFDSEDKQERQADIWEHYARIIATLADRVKVVPYESLCDEPQSTMSGVYRFLGVTQRESLWSTV